MNLMDAEIFTAVTLIQLDSNKIQITSAFMIVLWAWDRPSARTDECTFHQCPELEEKNHIVYILSCVIYF